MLKMIPIQTGYQPVIKPIRFTGERPSTVPLVANAVFLLGSLAFTTQHGMDVKEGKPLMSLTTLACACFSLGSALFTGHAVREFFGKKPPSENTSPEKTLETKN